MTNQRIAYTRPDGGISIIIPTGELTIEEVMAKDVPADATNVQVLDASEVPTDRTFRNAWKHCPVEKVAIDLDGAKYITHDRRRAKRAEEFAPHDEIIAKQIPGADAVAAEAARQEIRDRYAVIQSDVNAATTPAELVAIIEAEGL